MFYFKNIFQPLSLFIFYWRYARLGVLATDMKLSKCLTAFSDTFPTKLKKFKFLRKALGMAFET